MKEIVPYIYKLTFIPDGRVYIGSRFNKGGCHPDEFWVKYFTSSKHVKRLIGEYGTGRDVWSVEILEVFDGLVVLKDVPKRENEYILKHVERLGKAMMLNRRWFIGDKEVYTNAGMTYACKGISDASKGKVIAKDPNGNLVKVTKEEFESRDDLVGIGSGMKFYHHPGTQHRIKIQGDAIPPEGYIPGVGVTLSDERRSSLAQQQTGKTFINNGEVNKRWTKGDTIPEGWVEGRLKYDMPGWTDERRKKREETMKQKRDARLALQPPKSEDSIRRSEALKRAAEKRKAAGIPHGNAGRKKTPEEIAKQREARAQNNATKEAS